MSYAQPVLDETTENSDRMIQHCLASYMKLAGRRKETPLEATALLHNISGDNENRHKGRRRNEECSKLFSLLTQSWDMESRLQVRSFHWWFGFLSFISFKESHLPATLD